MPILPPIDPTQSDQVPGPPESIVLSAFTGLRNNTTRERLGPGDLEVATNIDLDDTGQASRRRGYTQKHSAPHHSLRTIGGRTFVVRSNWLGILDVSYGFTQLVYVGEEPVCYVDIGEDVYFSNNAESGVIGADNSVRPWGRTDGQGMWVSPVINPTATLGAVNGRLLTDPPRASCIEDYNGRIYLADGKTVWATELYAYDLIDRTKNFMQFEDEVTFLGAVNDGVYVGTTAGLVFLQGAGLGQFKVMAIDHSGVVRGSGVEVPTHLIHPVRNPNYPIATAVAWAVLTDQGVMGLFDGGQAYNLTYKQMVFPKGERAAALFRQDQGANDYVVAVDSGGSPSANARIGDYVDAEIVRRR